MAVSDLVYIDATGYHYADYPTFLAYFIAQYQAIYGADVYLEPDSQDGQWIGIQAQAAYDTAVNGAATYNSFSPVSAQGVGLSRLVKINGLERQVPSYSTVTLTIVGQANTVITNGIASDALGQQWALPSSVTISSGGTIDVTGTSVTVGAINAESDTITTIFTPTQGWQTVNNAAAATPGAAVESDSTLRARQITSVANPSLTVLEGTTGAIANLTGVTKVQPYENDTSTTDGNGVPGHSICMVVAGGDSTDIANAIELHKTPGCGTYGGTTVLVYDANGMPIEISFQEAVTATISVQITLASGSGWSTDYEAQIAAAVAAVINNLPIGGQVLTAFDGGYVIYTQLFAPAYLNGSVAGQTYTITSIEIKKNSGSFASSNIALDFDENPVCDPTADFTFVVT